MSRPLDNRFNSLKNRSTQKGKDKVDARLKSKRINPPKEKDTNESDITPENDNKKPDHLKKGITNPNRSTTPSIITLKPS